VPDTQLNAAELYTIIVDPRSINQILRDDGSDDPQMEKFWKIVGFPITEGVRQSVSLTIIIQNLAAAALGAQHPYAAKINRIAFRDWLTKQLSQSEADRVLAAIGWDVDVDKNVASIFTRMAKAIASR
jgi:hypothetical protein